MASKQLARDINGVTVPAKFVTHGQISCPLPRLDIHDPESNLTNFDLKDNTDHTRLFVRVSLAYGREAPRSPALDLLLYDSLCWDCDLSGECSVRSKAGNGRCFFATATSIVQVFRIGRTVSAIKSQGKYTITKKSLVGSILK